MTENIQSVIKLSKRLTMETKETNFSKENQTENSKLFPETRIVPRSVRPSKSMMRVKSLKPKRISIARKVTFKNK